jgi:hypothetical protein
MSVDPFLAEQAERIGGQISKRARKRRRPQRKETSGQPTIHITVNVPSAPTAEPSPPRRRKGSVRPGRVGDTDVVANGRSRIRRIGPSPG